jgi:hypothetical protein
MKRAVKLLIVVIVIPTLAYIAFYFIAKSHKCVPNCVDKKCGQTDGCYGVCKICPSGKICDGKSCQTPNQGSTKGICYFDIDGTITTANGDRDKMMRQCLDNNFAVGIITASPRRIEDICNGDKAKDRWMSDLLCKQFQDNGAKMYNSTKNIAGSTVFPSGYPAHQEQGIIKGFDMTFGRDSFYKDIPDKCIVLFDDQQPVLDGVRKFNPDLETQCANSTCGLGHVLDITTVKEKVKSMKANGCM